MQEGYYQVNEIFSTVQGEGYWTGVPATFIRLQGCSVGCPWCDTKYTWHAGGTKMHVSEIVEQIKHKHVVITGGEPTIWDLTELHYHAMRKVQSMGFKEMIQIETSGQNLFKGRMILQWVTWSPKRNLGFIAPADFLTFVNEIKFVVDEELTIEDVDKCIARFLEPDVKDNLSTVEALTFMAEGCPPTPASLHKAMDFAREFEDVIPRVMVSDRMQYRAEVK